MTTNIILSLPDPSDLRNQLDSIGYAVIKNAINKDFIKSQRHIWIDYFKTNQPKNKFVRGNLIYGEPNFDSFSSIPSWSMYRSFEFLWNTEKISKHIEVHKNLHQYRNTIQGYYKNYGLEFNEEHSSIYVSTSLYPINNGYLIKHKDGNGVKRIVHYMIPYTFKGTHYDEGGLFVEARNGLTIDVDSIVSEGDIIFFDGLINHEVKKIKSKKSDSAGRLASFAVPTNFMVANYLALKKRSTFIWFKEVLNKLGLHELY